MSTTQAFMASKSRHGGSTLFWGPFATIEELHAWADKHNLTVGVHELVNPDSEEQEWWNLP